MAVAASRGGRLYNCLRVLKSSLYLVYTHVYPCGVSNRLYFLFTCYYRAIARVCMRERVLSLSVSMSCRVRLPDCVSSVRGVPAHVCALLVLQTDTPSPDPPACAPRPPF